MMATGRLRLRGTIAKSDIMRVAQHGWSRHLPAAPGVDIAEFWRSLPVPRDANPDFYAFINSIRPDAEPFLLAHRRAGSMALLVGRIEVRPVVFALGHVSLQGPKLRILEIVHGGIVGTVGPSLAEEAVAVFVGMLARRELDAVHLHYADPASPLFKSIAASPGFLKRDRSVTRQPHHFRALDRRTDFLSSISANERAQQRKRHKRLLSSGAGCVQVRALHTQDDLQRLLTDAEQVASQSYQRGLGVGFSRSADVERRLEWLAERSWLRAWIVYVGTVPAAFWIGTLQGGVFVSDYLAYDSTFQHLAPGTFLNVHVLSELQKPGSGTEIVDFGPGEAAYKQRFGNGQHTCASVYLFAGTPKAVLINACRTVLHGLSAAARAALGRSGYLATFRKISRKFMSVR